MENGDRPWSVYWLTTAVGTYSVALPYLSKVRNTDGGSVAINLHPFVGPGIAVPLLNCRCKGEHFRPRVGFLCACL